MLSDLEIAQQAKIIKIKEIAAKVGLSEDDLELYGKYKAKISENVYQNLKDKRDGFFTAISMELCSDGRWQLVRC